MGSDPEDGESATGRSPETVDRILVGVCGAIWLVLLTTTVFAAVALVRLGSGQAADLDSQSSWLLYSIITISALVIAGAIPLLIRARQTARADPPAPAPEPAAPARSADAPTEKLRVFGVDPAAPRQLDESGEATPVPPALVDRLWLRGTSSILGAMGLALTAVAVATYLLAVSSDTAAWVTLGVAAAITVAMPAVLVLFQRRLNEAVDAAGAATP
ncbi:MAG: DUF2561 family protein [Actinomycetia bacterium]|nr:DUF2561 family protein [Actinomycetes bacterium]